MSNWYNNRQGPEDMDETNQFGPPFGPPFGQGPGEQFQPPFGPPFGQGPGGQFQPPFGPPFGQGPGGQFQPPFGPPFGQGPGGQFQPPFGPPFGQGGPPSGPPPSFIPQQAQGISVQAVDPGTIRFCRFRYVYIWLTTGQQFWAWLVFVGPRSIAGWRWAGFRWVYFGLDLDFIASFVCF